MVSGSEEERSAGTVLGLWQVADTHCPSPSLLLQPRVGLELIRTWGWGLQSLEDSELRVAHQTLGENSPRLPNIGRSELGPGSKACPVL